MVDKKKLIADSWWLSLGNQWEKERIHKAIKTVREVQTWWQPKAMISVTPVHPDGNGNEK